MAVGSTLHIATRGFHVEPLDKRGNPLSIATIYHALSTIPALIPNAIPQQVFDLRSPAIVRRSEQDHTRPRT